MSYVTYNTGLEIMSPVSQKVKNWNFQMPTYVYKYLRLIYCRLHLLIGIDVLILILTAILIKNHPTHVHTLSIKSWTRELGTKTA